MLITWLAIVAALVGIGYAGFLALKIIKQKVDDKGAEVVSVYIKKGATSFLSKQYRILLLFVLVLAIIIFLIPGFSWQLAITFIIGAIFSMASGFIGMRISTIANIRTAEKFQNSFRAGLEMAFSAGTVVGLAVASLGLLGVAVLYLIFGDPIIIYGFALGASLVALFARVGGGIFTKAADIGADLTGKIESGIPEDDPRNPATIADNIGDNVSDVAGSSADLFESYVSAIIATMVLGISFLPLFGSKAIILPLLLAGVGIIATILGKILSSFIKNETKIVLNLAVCSSAILFAIGAFFAVRFTVADLNIFWSVILGLVAGIVIGLFTEHYVSEKNRSIRKIAHAAGIGAATNVIAGLSFGLLSTIIPTVVIIAIIYLSYIFSGLYGVAIAAVGILSSLGMVLATSICGPIADNAAGIAEMSGMGSDIKERAEKLDAIGNTTSTVAKSFAISSAVLTALVLLISFGKEINLEFVNLFDVRVMAGLFIGGLLPFIFSALTIGAVGKTAEKIVNEVKRQFREITGLTSGQAEPDYKRCIEIATMSSMRQMLLPGALIILAPIVVGFGLGVASLTGMLAGAIVVGFLLAVFMNNAGGALDNAKKYIEADNLGGKGSEAHKAAVVGDSVGDPLKDVAGPALNILIKLMAIISIIIAPLLMK